MQLRSGEFTVTIEPVVALRSGREIALGDFEMQSMYERRPIEGVVDRPLREGLPGSLAEQHLDHMTRTVFAVLSDDAWQLLRVRLKTRGIDLSPDVFADAPVDYDISDRLRASVERSS